MPILYDRAVVLAKIETTFGTDAIPTASSDALLVEDPQFSYDVTQLERNNVSATISPETMRVGRKTASVSFMVEVRNNGNTSGTVAPMVGRLLRACGYSETQFTGTATIKSSAPLDVKTPSPSTGTFTFTKTAAYTGTLPRTVTLLVTTAGGSGTVRFTVSAPAIGDLPAISTTSVAMTSGSAFALANGATITPTVGTSFVVGDKYTIELEPAGYSYKPVSNNFESATLYVYYDGLLHKMTGARGTFTVEGTGNAYAKFNFTMTGNYVPVADAAMPTTPVYESQKPDFVELAGLQWTDATGATTSVCASQFSIDAGNEIAIRECINSAAAYEGALIVDRAPTLSFDPEAVTVATHDFFGNLASGAQLQWFVRVGTIKGNVVSFVAPNLQYSNVQYGNRNSLRTFEVEGRLARLTDAGNDELEIIFS